MRKSNVILQAAVAAAFGLTVASVQATTVTATAPAFAKELLLGTTPNATALTIPTTGAITVIANVGIPASSIVYVYVKLNGASISTIPSVAPGIPSALVGEVGGADAAAGVSITLTAASLGTTTGAANPGAVGAGVDYIVFRVTTVATAIGVGNTIAVIGGPATGVGTSVALAMNNATALLTAPITTTASVGLGAPSTRFGALGVTASNYDATSAATNIATNVQGVTLAAAAATTAGLIDLVSSPVGSQFTTTGTNVGLSAILAKLGTLTATNSATAKQAGGVTAYTMASQAGVTGLTSTVTAPAGFFAALRTAGRMTLDVSPVCAAGVAGTNGMTSAGFASDAAAAAATSVTIPSTSLPTSGTTYYLCMVLPANSGTSPAMIPGTPTLAATIVHTDTATDSNETLAATNMYALALNGAQVDVRNYVPAAQTGWSQWVRVINTGTISGAVSGQFIDETTGAVIGSPVVLIPSLAAGGVTNLSAVTIEGALGAQAAGARPRLRITAPINGLEAMNFLFTPNGSFTAAHGRDGN